jgi:hypothetical protein
LCSYGIDNRRRSDMIRYIENTYRSEREELWIVEIF